jgi:hypothetical protein
MKVRESQHRFLTPMIPASTRERNSEGLWAGNRTGCKKKPGDAGQKQGMVFFLKVVMA